jgi:hypothetical protein
MAPDGTGLINLSGGGTSAGRATGPSWRPGCSHCAGPTATHPELSKKVFMPATKGPSIGGAKAGPGTTISFRLSLPAVTTFSVLKAAGGSLKRVPGSFTFRGDTGLNRFRFTGRIGGHTLRPGKYQLVGQARDLVGNPGDKVRLAFRIAG